MKTTIAKKIVELLNFWNEFEDILFIENEDGDLELYRDFHNFKKGTTQFEIWHSIDEKLPNGNAELLGA